MYSKQDEFSEETAPQQIDVYQETAAYQANDTSDDVNVYPKKDDEKISFLSFPWRVRLIVLNEVCERFSYYGFRAILALYLSEVLNFSEEKSISVYSNFSAFAYCMPILGGLISDAYWGRYKTIIICSTLYLIGSVILSGGAWDHLNPNNATWPMYVAMVLTSLGTGGIKPCVSTFGADQLNKKGPNGTSLTTAAAVSSPASPPSYSSYSSPISIANPQSQDSDDSTDMDSHHTLISRHPNRRPYNVDDNNNHIGSDSNVAIDSLVTDIENVDAEQLADIIKEEQRLHEVRTQSFFYMFYFSMNIGSVLSLILIPIIRSHVSYALAFAIPALLLFVSVVILLIGDMNNLFIKVPPGTSPLTIVARIFCRACRNRSRYTQLQTESHESPPRYSDPDHNHKSFDVLSMLDYADIEQQQKEELKLAQDEEDEHKQITNDLSNEFSKSIPLNSYSVNNNNRYDNNKILTSNYTTKSDKKIEDRSNLHYLDMTEAERKIERAEIIEHRERYVGFMDWLEAAFIKEDPIDSNSSRSVSDVSNISNSPSFSSNLSNSPTSSSSSSNPEPIITHKDIRDSRRLLSLIPIFSCLPFFWCVMNQQGSTWVYQAKDMDLKIFGYAIEPEQLQVINPIVLFILLPLLEWLFRSATTTIEGIKKRKQEREARKESALNSHQTDIDADVSIDAATDAATNADGLELYDEDEEDEDEDEASCCQRFFAMSTLSKLGLGFFIASVAYVVAAIVDMKVHNSPPKSVSILFQLPQYVILTAAEVLVSVTGLHFAFEKAPSNMKSLVTGLLMLSSALGDLITGVFYDVFKSMGLERWEMFIVFAAGMFVNVLYFLFIRYKYEHMFV